MWYPLRHPNVPKLYGACDAGHYLFVCEYASRGSLADHVKARPSETSTRWRLLHEAALGLAYLHERNIIHGNLRGSNILIGDSGLAKLSAFGSSRSTRREPSSEVGGPMRWQPSEQLRGEPPSLAADIYSLGMCVVEAVTGEVPWAHERDAVSVSFAKWQWDPDLLGHDEWAPGQLSDDEWVLLKRMCCRNPSKRVRASKAASLIETLSAKVGDNERAVLAGNPPISVVEFDNGKLVELWDDIRAALARQAESTCVQEQVLQECDELLTRLQRSRQPHGLLDKFRGVLVDFRHVIEGGHGQIHLLQLSTARTTSSRLGRIRRRIAVMRDQLDGPNALDDNNATWEERKRADIQVFVSKVSQEWLVSNELKSEEDRRAFLTCLKAEIEIHQSNYQSGDLEAMMKAYADIARQSGVELAGETPPWYLPWYELVIDKSTPLGVGGFSRVYRAKWLDSDVVVKELTAPGSTGQLDDSSAEALTWTRSVVSTDDSHVDSSQRRVREEALKEFEREVGIWFNRNHPHVVRLFGACHVGTPFFVCEYASKGSLDKYLRQHPGEIWQKLHQAALGVLYLHANGIVHGDLKCNNVMIGADGKAKVTDFGLSSLLSQDIAQISGAWHWVAPECLSDDKPSPTLASDVYSLGMCIVEALRIVDVVLMDSDANLPSPPLPWGSLPNAAVKHHVMKAALPSHPRSCSEKQWALIEKMSAFNPKERVKMCTLVDELAQFAQTSSVGSIDETEVDSPTCYDNPSLHTEDVISEATELVKAELSLEQGANHVILCRVYGLLWARLAHVYGRITDNQTGKRAFRLLVDRARVATTRLEHFNDTITAFNGIALGGYALHRRLDTFVSTHLLVLDDIDVNLHNWQPACD